MLGDWQGTHADTQITSKRGAALTLGDGQGTRVDMQITKDRSSTDQHREGQQGQEEDDVEVEEAVQQVVGQGLHTCRQAHSTVTQHNDTALLHSAAA